MVLDTVETGGRIGVWEGGSRVEGANRKGHLHLSSAQQIGGFKSHTDLSVSGCFLADLWEQRFISCGKALRPAQSAGRGSAHLQEPSRPKCSRELRPQSRWSAGPGVWCLVCTASLGTERHHHFCPSGVNQGTNSRKLLVTEVLDLGSVALLSLCAVRVSAFSHQPLFPCKTST